MAVERKNKIYQLLFQCITMRHSDRDQLCELQLLRQADRLPPDWSVLAMVSCYWPAGCSSGWELGRQEEYERPEGQAGDAGA